MKRDTAMQRLFAVAGAHGLDVGTLMAIAETELGKPLSAYTIEEIFNLIDHIEGTDES